MKKLLRRVGCGVLVVGVLFGIGYTVNRYRQRALERWTVEQGGTFEAGGILEGVAVLLVSGEEAALSVSRDLLALADRLRELWRR